MTHTPTHTQARSCLKGVLSDHCLLGGQPLTFCPSWLTDDNRRLKQNWLTETTFHLMYWQNELNRERRNSWCFFQHGRNMKSPCDWNQVSKNARRGQRPAEMMVMIAKSIRSFYKEGWGDDRWRVSSRANRVGEKKQEPREWWKTLRSY